jgi:hypothetical protein
LKLSKTGFSKAEEFIHSNARPLDVLLFEHHFEDRSKDDLLQELKRFQNSDGGFGNAIEPDFRLSASSAMATSVGLQYCVEVDVEPDNDIVKSAMEYLTSTFNDEHAYWSRTPIEVNDEPHAPWWHVDEIKPPAESSWANPNAELLGYLHRFQDHIPNELLVKANIRALDNLNNLETIESLYCFMNWERAYQSVPEPLKSLISEKVGKTLQTFEPNPDTLGEIRVFWIAPTPESFLLSFPRPMHSLQDYEIDRQGEDGGWWPTWNWGQYEDVWPIAEREWAGKITVGNLIAMDEFKLLEET